MCSGDYTMIGRWDQNRYEDREENVGLPRVLPISQSSDHYMKVRDLNSLTAGAAYIRVYFFY